MKKRIMTLAFVMSLALGGSMLLLAAESKTGGYPYTDADGKIELAKYFTMQGADIEIKKDCVDFILQEEEATLTFNKALASDNFQLTFLGVKGNTLQEIEILLSDAENDKETVEIAYGRMSSTQTSVTVNDGNRSFITNGSLYEENDGVFSVTYRAKSNTFGDGGTLVIPVPETIYGEGFSEFGSNKANLTIRLTGAKGSVFSLQTLNQQRMGSKYTKDDTPPMISVLNPVNYVTKGSTITLPTAFATDVLAEHSSVTMSVLDPEGNTVKATNGTKLEDVVPNGEYQLKIEQYGTYRVEFKATDGKNKTRAVVSRINVLDNAAPEIKLDSSIPVTHKVGEKLTFPEVTCTDGGSDAENIRLNVLVKHPDGTITAEAKSIELTEKGVYEITFMAVDEQGNIGRVTKKTYAEGE